MPQSPILPPSAPFDAAQRATLDGVLVNASPVQRAWLAGFLAGMDAQTGAAPAASVAVEPAPAAAEPLTILFATESGNSEALAHSAAKRARKLGFKPRVVDLAAADLPALANARNLLVVAATWGEGEPPGRAAHAYAALMGDDAPRLDGVRFGVLGLGDTSYAEFCAIGAALDARLEALGGTRTLDRADCDLDYQDQADAWIGTALDRLRPAAPAPAAPAVAEAVGETVLDAVGEVVEHVNLNSSRSAKETVHLAMAFADGTPPYEPGDSLELFPQNDPVLVDRVLASAGLAGDDALRQALLVERDVTTLSQVTVERFAQATGHASVRTMLADGQARAWADGRQLIDLLQTYPAALSAEQLTALTRKLPPRAYSIASSRKEVGDEAHLLVAAVRYEAHGERRAGVASVHVADRVRTGALLKVRLKPNPRFRLPADPATDIIMVGPGTGVAPFRAFVQERRAIGAKGRSWLFFGDQRFTHDFLYQLEWQEALEDGSLTRIDVAFSRDQPDKVYVQDRIWTNRRDFVDWMEGGAHFYVCGDAKAMAKDVRRTVVRAYADVKALDAGAAEALVRQLEASNRFQQDVY